MFTVLLNCVHCKLLSVKKPQGRAMFKIWDEAWSQGDCGEEAFCMSTKYFSCDKSISVFNRVEKVWVCAEAHARRSRKPRLGWVTEKRNKIQPLSRVFPTTPDYSVGRVILFLLSPKKTHIKWQLELLCPFAALCMCQGLSAQFHQKTEGRFGNTCSCGNQLYLAQFPEPLPSAPQDYENNKTLVIPGQAQGPYHLLFRF